MLQTYENEFTMFSTVRDYLNAHTADTTGVPALVTALSSLSTVINQIDAAVTAQSTPLTGIADDKEMLRTTLEEATFLISEALAALAAATNNHTLLDEVGLTRSALDRLSAEALDAHATRVATRATANQTVLTGTYNLSPAQVTAITTARTAWAPYVNKPRAAVVERAAITASLPALIRQGRAILTGQLDRIMSRYRVPNPTLFAGYESARVVIDRRGAGTRSTLEIATLTKTGPTTATLTYSNRTTSPGAVILLQWQAPGETIFGHDVPATPPSQIVTHPSFAGATITFRTQTTLAGVIHHSAEHVLSF